MNNANNKRPVLLVVDDSTALAGTQSSQGLLQGLRELAAREQSIVLDLRPTPPDILCKLSSEEIFRTPNQIKPQ